ncbi:hypothetical protein CHS0354_040264 [Potamilus streckersoni]|nr:hypothetical protein CHS0354_040264 [Potamilus streckersoni]
MRGPGVTQYRNIRHYSATEKYMEQAVLLYGKGNKETCYLPVGRHSYPFQFQLPSVIPSSFEGDHGYIRFWVKGTIEKNWRTYHVTKLPFTVISPLDLNKIPAANVSYLVIYKLPPRGRRTDDGKLTQMRDNGQLSRTRLHVKSVEQSN